MRCYSCRKYDNCELPWKCSSTMYDCSAYELEQTNEEWFDTLSTEEKADLLFGTFYLAGRNDEKNGVWKGVDTIMEWLKQPHTFK